MNEHEIIVGFNNTNPNTHQKKMKQGVNNKDSSKKESSMNHQPHVKFHLSSRLFYSEFPNILLIAKFSSTTISKNKRIEQHCMLVSEFHFLRWWLFGCCVPSWPHTKKQLLTDNCQKVLNKSSVNYLSSVRSLLSSTTSCTVCFPITGGANDWRTAKMSSGRVKMTSEQAKMTSGPVASRHSLVIFVVRWSFSPPARRSLARRRSFPQINISFKKYLATNPQKES